MSRRTRIIIVIVLGVGPLLVGTIGAVSIIAPSMPKERDGRLAAASDRDDRHRLRGA